MKNATIFGSFLAAALATVLGATVILTSSDIVKMSKAGLSDDVIIQTIQSTGSNFHLAAEDVDSLKRDGVSDLVVAAMQTARLAVPPSAASTALAVPVVREPSGRDYVGGLIEQPVVRALPVAPPVYYDVPPTMIYSYPCYYPVPRYYCGPPVRFYFGYGGGRRHCW